MSMLENLVDSVVSTVKSREPAGTVHVVDHSPLNWLYITYNTVEELVRIDRGGHIVPAAMSNFKWVDDVTLEIKVRAGEVFQDGEILNAQSVKRSFDEMMRWRAPHPPGTQFNLDSRTRCEVVDDATVRLVFPQPDGLALGKLRAMHIMNTRFWNGPGFGYKRQFSGEGHW